MSSDTKPNEDGIQYEQLRDLNNRQFGYVVRWCINRSPFHGFLSVTADLFEITATQGQPFVEGFPVGPFRFAETDFEMDKSNEVGGEQNEFTYLPPTLRLYIKSDGCSHLWFSPYLHVCSPNAICDLANVLKYLAGRALEFGKQENKMQHDELSRLEPLFSSKPYVPSPL